MKKPAEEKDELLCLLIDDFLKNDWNGTATELSDALKQVEPGADITPLNIKKKLKSAINLFKDNDIEVDFDRENGSGKKLIFLTRRSEQQTVTV